MENITQKIPLIQLILGLESLKSAYDHSLIDISYDYHMNRAVIVESRTKRAQAIVDFNDEHSMVLKLQSPQE